MALSRIKTWIAEVLTYADLNAEFDNILTNGAGSLSSPRTASFDLNGYSCVLDAPGGAYMQAGSTNIVDFYGNSTLLFRIDMSVSTPVNALAFSASAAGSHPSISSRGSDTNVGIQLQPKGSGKVTIDGGLNYVEAAGSADAITATYAPAITALDDGLELCFKATASNATSAPTLAVNGLSAKVIVKHNGAALSVGDVAGSSHVVVVRYSATTDKWHIINPATATTDLNSLVTDATGGAQTDLVPFIDASDSNASNKVLVPDFFYNAISGSAEDTTPQTVADFVVTADTSSSAAKKVRLDRIGVGKQTIWVPATAMTPRTTSGAASGTSETATNKVMNKVLDYDGTTQEFAQFCIAFPKGWNEGTISFVPYWTAASGSGGVVWALQAVAVSDDDVIDAAFGTEQTSTDTLLATTDIHVGPESASITISGSPAVGDMVFFQIKRNPADASDTLTADARLLGIKIIYTTDSNVDD